jgi:hypothetical protein
VKLHEALQTIKDYNFVAVTVLVNGYSANIPATHTPRSIALMKDIIFFVATQNSLTLSVRLCLRWKKIAMGKTYIAVVGCKLLNHAKHSQKYINA